MIDPIRFSVATLLALGVAVPAALADEHGGKPKGPVTEAMVTQSLDRWCAGLLEIGKAARSGGDVKAAANRALDESYVLEKGRLLFKPTLTSGDQTFRVDREGALAYFIGGDPKYPADQGFAMKPWVGCRYDTIGTIIEGDVAITMGNVWVKDEKGAETKVDKSFVFERGDDGKLRLLLHHSSLPFTPAP